MELTERAGVLNPADFDRPLCGCGEPRSEHVNGIGECNLECGCQSYKATKDSVENWLMAMRVRQTELAPA
jgi:hypothetical protein